MKEPDFCSWLRTLQQYLYHRKHRKLIVLHGELGWANSCSREILVSFKEQIGDDISYLIWGQDVQLSEGDNEQIIVNNYRHQLGTENHLVFFGDDQFHPDAFAALSGTICAGGVMVWLCPPKLISQPKDLFIQRLWRQISNDNQTVILTPEIINFPKSNDVNATQMSVENLPSLPLDFCTSIAKQDADKTFESFQKEHAECLTAEQNQAVLAIGKVCKGHSKRPLVLTADRGRGKSSALAIATANRLENYQGKDALTIIITAPHFDAVSIYFSQLSQSCPLGELGQGSFIYQQHRVKFLPIDILLKDKPKAHLLLVDEAAAIPVYILSQLLDVYHRVVFSSTQHGYEGAGRGFATKFQTILAKKAPDYNKLHLNQPIRWAEHDPLESIIFDGFLLNTVFEDGINQRTVHDNTLGEIKIIPLTQQQLVDNEAILRQVFAVLVSAHYQTTPSDLKLLLNNPSLIIFTALHDEKVIGVLLAMREGNVDHDSVEQVKHSQKRLKDQFIPQSLCLYNHCQQAFEYQYLRIMRIAVIEKFQHLGVGTKLLERIKEYGATEQIDFLGTSFGANPALLSFWFENDYQAVHLGFTADKASGEHSVMLLKAMSDSGQFLFKDIQQRFYQQFIYLLSEQYQSISPSVISTIIKACPKKLLPQLSEFDLSLVKGFSEKQSLLSSSAYSLHIWLQHFIHTKEFEQLPKKESGLLIFCLLQRHSIEQSCHKYGLTGKKQLNQTLVSIIRQYFQSAIMLR